MKKSKLDRKSGNSTLFIVLAFIGALLLGVLVFLQLRFTVSMRFANDGLAIESGTVSKYLAMSPTNEALEREVTLKGFFACDSLYEQNTRLFLGEDKKKTQIDGDFPVYLNHGAVLQLVTDEALLIDEDFAQIDTYQGMMLTEGHSYNLDGTMADAADYLFLKLVNGNYVNLCEMTYSGKAEDKVIPAHSLIHFESDYFAYYEYVDDSLVYRYRADVPGAMIIKVGNKQMTYTQLLELLGIDMKTVGPQMHDKEEFEESTEELEIGEDEDNSELFDENESGEIVGEESADSAVVEVPSTDQQTNKKPNEHTTPGVRPDSIRGETDNNPSTPPKEVVPEYVKPEVAVSDFTAGVYRLNGSVTVFDPASRIDKTKQIQFEVYEIDSKGKEKLVLRSYRMGTGPVELGSGAIKPSTNYHVRGYVTYANEFDEKVVEELADFTIETKGLDSLGAVTITQTPGDSYNNKFEINNFGFEEGSDEEAIYGISVAGGLSLSIHKQGGVDNSKLDLSTAQIGKFKKNVKQMISSLANLKAKTTYTYEFVACDYFGNEIELLNATGEVRTSNNVPSATLAIKKNEIDNVVLSLSIVDEDASTVPVSGNSCDVYVVLTQTKDGIASIADATSAEYVYKLTEADYTYDDENGLVVSDLLLPSIQGLGLSQFYYATVYCDYDLENGRGVQKFSEIGQLSFKSAGLSSLGKIYLTSSISDITSNGALVTFKLNTNASNEQLYKLIKDVSFEVTRKEDGEVDDVIGFTASDVVVDENGESIPIYKQFQDGIAVAYYTDGLFSMTEYELKPHVIATYGDYTEELVVSMDNSSFKTMRKKATVEIKDLLCAAGILEFDVFVDDADQAICGNSGDKVVVNLYTEDGVFVKAQRIQKNQNVTVSFTGLDVQKAYEIRFLAVEYNEGYTNATLESNRVLHSEIVSASVTIKGDIKLQHVDELNDDPTHMSAYTLATISAEDKDLFAVGNQYFVKVEKDGKLVYNDAYAIFGNTPKNEKDLYLGEFKHTVDVGDHTYKYTLYVIVNNRALILDTLEFTTEKKIVGFSTAYELIHLMQNDPTGKYVALNDIILYSNSENYENGIDPSTIVEIEDGEEGASSSVAGIDKVSGARVVTTFDGAIDFQGFTLSHHYIADNQNFVQHWGPKAKLSNVVYDVYLDSDARIYDEGCWCYYNMGTISDVVINYKGQYNILNNLYFAPLCRVNTTSGTIERFVAVLEPEEDRVTLTGERYVSIVCVSNHGYIRDGYAVYGNETGKYIYLTDLASYTNRYIGAICGVNNALGRINDTYSLINCEQGKREGSNYSNTDYYGAICGYSNGYLNGIYSIGESIPVENKNQKTTESAADYGIQTSPTVGHATGKFSNVYYWYDSENATVTYTGKQSQLTSIDSLYDPGWQAGLLGAEYDCSTVEIGYYPHLNYSSELPEQKYIPLPARVNDVSLGISQATVQEYFTLEDGTDAARVKFVLFNKNNQNITNLMINGVDVTLDIESAESADGFTTIYGTISNPTTYSSTYPITAIVYTKNGKKVTNTLTPSYPLQADFYRPISTPEEWYGYVVKKAADGVIENVKLVDDIDFENVDASRIMVTSTYYAKIDGQNHSLKNIDLQNNFKNTNNYTCRNLFNSVEATSSISHLYVENYKAGGTYTRSGKTYVARYAGLVNSLYGTMDDVHIRGIDLVGYDRMGCIASYVGAAGEVSNCSVVSYGYGVTMTYTQPTGVDSTICLGGLIGNLSNGRVYNSYVTDVNIDAIRMRSSNGVGGAIGYSNNSVIDSVYATGMINTRATAVGGVVGRYYVSDIAYSYLKNVISKVDIVGTTDIIGGIVGLSDLKNNYTNNISGVAFGNVYSANPDAKNVSRTIGQSTAGIIKMYASFGQQINGASDVALSEHELENTYGILNEEQLTSGAQETYRKLAGFTAEYEYHTDGFLPKLYYNDSTKLLPDQTDISIGHENDYDLYVTNIYVNENNRIITIRISNPKHYMITDLQIDSLSTHYVKYENSVYKQTDNLLEASDYTGDVTVLMLQYDSSQAHCLDSYTLRGITLYSEKDSAFNGMDYQTAKLDVTKQKTLDVTSRIPLTLYHEINSVESYANIINYDDFENYKVTDNINFESASNYPTELNIGRLVSDGKTIQNMKLKDVCMIAQLNSAMDGLFFENIEVTDKNQTDNGIISVSNGTISNCHFKNISITSSNVNASETAIIGRQNGGEIKNITLDNIAVSAVKTQSGANTNYTAGLVGYVDSSASISGIKAKNLEIAGRSYVAGLFGYIYSANVDDILIENSNLTANGNNVGFVATVAGNNNNANYCTVTNVTVKGTPSYDASGNITGSTTSIVATSGDDVGAVFGYSREAICYSYVDGKRLASSVNVEGVYIKSAGNHVGGGIGYATYGTYGITVKNSKVEASGTDTRSNFGGVVGTDTGNSGYLVSENNQIDTQNRDNVGSVYGQRTAYTGSFVLANNVTVNAKTTKTDSARNKNVGGLVGYSNNSTLSKSGAINVLVDAPTMQNVGGIAGQLGSGISSGGTLSNNFFLCQLDPANADSEYAANATSEYVVRGYSEVGGLVGYQCGSSNNYSYSNANVVATADSTKATAGGLVGYYHNGFTKTNNIYTYGSCYMACNYFAGTVTATHGYAGGAIGRLGLVDVNNQPSGSRANVEGVGKYDESARTTRNIILASKVNGVHAGAIAADDPSFVGGYMRLWDGVEVDGITVDTMYPASAYVSTSANGLPTWKVELQLFRTSQIEEPDPAKTGKNESVASRFYRVLGWSMVPSDNSMNRNYSWRVNLKGREDSYSSTGTTEANTLPQIRSATTTKYASDDLMKYQDLFGPLPIPQHVSLENAPATTSYSLMSMADDVDSYGIMYASDIDKLNVEFSSDLLGQSFTLKRDDEVVYSGTITQRVYTFAYDFTGVLTLSYGEIEDSVLGKNLARTIMVSKDKYYYINADKQIVYGTDTQSGVMNGSYCHLMNHKALTTEGNIIDLTNQQVLGSVSEMKLLENTTPLYASVYEGKTIFTYARCSEVYQNNQVVIRDAQMFVANNRLYAIDGTMHHQPDGIIVFDLNGTPYFTILDENGYLMDIYQEEVILPEKVSNKGIELVSNTLLSNAPYVIISYANGGKLGYNYVTGEILFDERIPSEISLFDYAAVYLGEMKHSAYKNISDTYLDNERLASALTTKSDLDAVYGHNSGDIIIGNSTGEVTQTAGDNQGVTGENQAPAINTGIGETISGDGDAPGSSDADGNASNGGTSEGSGTDAGNGIGTGNGAGDANGTGNGSSASKNEDAGSIIEEKPTTGSFVLSQEEVTELPQLTGVTTMDNRNFITIYNKETGVYEIVYVEDYLTDPAYVSENVRLGVTNLAATANVSGYALSNKDKNNQRGIVMYLVAAILILGTIGGAVIVRRKRK